MFRRFQPYLYLLELMALNRATPENRTGGKNHSTFHQPLDFDDRFGQRLDREALVSGPLVQARGNQRPHSARIGERREARKSPGR